MAKEYKDANPYFGNIFDYFVSVAGMSWSPSDPFQCPGCGTLLMLHSNTFECPDCKSTTKVDGNRSFFSDGERLAAAMLGCLEVRDPATGEVIEPPRRKPSCDCGAVHVKDSPHADWCSTQRGGGNAVDSD